MRRLITVLLLAVMPGPLTYAQEEGSRPAGDPGTAAGPAVSALRFVGPPRWRTVRMSPDINLGGELEISAAVEARGADGSPSDGLPVTLFARSEGGPVARGHAVADGLGMARLEAQFTLPAMSLDVTVQACATANPSVCTPVVGLRVSRRLDIQADVGVAYAFIPLAAGEVTATSFNPYVAINALAVSVVPSVEARLWASESRSGARGLSIYGSFPVLYQHLGGEGLTGRWSTPWGVVEVDRTIASSAGVGSFQVGSRVQLSRSILVDVAYLMPLGSRGVIDGLRQFGSAQPVSFGGGVPSLDLNASASHSWRDGGAGVFLFGTASRAFERSFPDGRVGRRGTSYEAGGGPVFLNATRYFAFAPWAGFAHQGRYSVSGISTSPGAATEESSEARLGLTVFDQRGGPATAQVAAFLGWPIGGPDKPYFSVSLLLSLRDLLRAAR